MQGHRLFLDYKVICSTIHPSTLPRKPSANPLIDAYLKDVAFSHQQYPLRATHEMEDGNIAAFIP